MKVDLVFAETWRDRLSSDRETLKRAADMFLDRPHL